MKFSANLENADFQSCKRLRNLTSCQKMGNTQVFIVHKQRPTEFKENLQFLIKEYYLYVQNTTCRRKC